MPSANLVIANSNTNTIWLGGQPIFRGTSATSSTSVQIVYATGGGRILAVYPPYSSTSSITQAFNYTTTGTSFGTVSSYFTGGTNPAFYVSCTPSVIVFSDEELRQHARAREIDARSRIRRRCEQVHLAKGAIKRAIKLMDNVGFGSDVRVFLGGDTVEVSHPDSMFKFLLSKAHHSIVDRTISPGRSTPYRLELYTKTDVHVANLCVYMEDTPMLDQILAVSMFVRTGDENYILEKANWSCVVRDPVMRDAIKLHAPSLHNKLR
jgi:hypothetical protein